MKLLRTLFALLTSAACLAAFAAEKAPRNPAGFKIRRGVNLSHWLSQCPRSGLDRDTYITERDFAFIRSIGYDHVRIPIDEVELWSTDGRRIDSAFKHLTNALDWSRKHGLRAIVDLHIIRSHHFNSEYGANTLWTDPAAQQKLLDLWADLSRTLKPYPVDAVAYEIMNEPVADNPEDWNSLIAKAVSFIRTLEPQRVLVIGSNMWQGAGTFPSLKVPAGDRNIILSVHDYEPFTFTHHQAGWSKFRDYRGPVHYPGVTITKEDHAAIKDPTLRKELAGGTQQWDRARLEKHLRPAIDKARELNLELYCGEFGCLPTVPRKDRLAWYADIISVFDQHDIAWANWEYKADFGIIPFDFDSPEKPAVPDRELIKVMLTK